jgi:hypothetical protein
VIIFARFWSGGSHSWLASVIVNARYVTPTIVCKNLGNRCLLIAAVFENKQTVVRDDRLTVPRQLPY